MTLIAKFKTLLVRLFNRSETKTVGAFHKPIVTWTDVAVAKMREALETSELPYLRLAVKGTESTGFYYQMGVENELDPSNDYLDVSHGIAILVDHQSAKFLVGTKGDWIVNDKGVAGFIFDNPNAVTS